MTVPIDHRKLRSAFGQFPTGVTIIASKFGDNIHGMTANSFSSVSLDPPMLLVCVANKARMLSVVTDSGRFGISILGDDQRDISNHFARSGNDAEIRFEDFDGTPVIAGALARFACKVQASHLAGDHTIFVGEVLGCELGSGAPLLFHSGKYLNMANW
jgi:flavin reductase (DIM6/NTAB) family NADH-FMN oxidoreductase RutF